MKQEILTLIQELRQAQEKNLLETGRRLVPTLTPEDMLQPNDYDILETNPHFRYEEGILHGILSAESALRCELSSRLYG